MSAVGRIIRSVSCLIPKDVSATGYKFRSALKNGFQVGKRCARINNFNIFDEYAVKTRAIAKNFKSTQLSGKDVPPILGVLTSFVPIPGTVFVGYGLGHGIKYAAKLFKF